MKGTVRRVIADRGFGFITDEAGESRFFHINGVVPPGDFDKLSAGCAVSFEPVTTERGLRAEGVVLEAAA